MVTASPFSVSVEPMTSGATASRRCQNACVRMAARGPPAWCSASTNSHPRAGGTPSTSKKRGAMSTPLKRSGSPRPVSVVLRKSKNAK